ncbi:hypothetical protein KJ359_001255 [Pestalotiopsis sp. 9143b]|nr:hypothetical protein KJ359_001255 [Pestalotiopsis sp. 9143b]
MSRSTRMTFVHPDKFKAVFPTLKPTVYNDPNTARTPGKDVGCDRVRRQDPARNVDKPNVRQSTELKGHTGAVEKVGFNPVKELELCSVSSDGTVKFWDVRTRNIINEVKGLGEAFTLAWAPDGESLVVGNKADTLFVLSPTQSTPLSSHQQSVQTNNIAFCWSGKRIYATTSEGYTRILQYPSLEPALLYDYKEPKDAEMKLHGHTSACTAVEIHPMNRFLATGGNDSLISLWDTEEWNCQRTITKMVGPIKSISFSFDGFCVVGGSDEGNAMEFTNCETGEHLFTYKTASPCSLVAWAPNRYALAYCELGTLRIISAGAK